MKSSVTRHAREVPVPAEALLADDAELWLVWAPLHDDAPGCQYEACESDEFCICQREVADDE
jgi:hypothetical protein